jgi:protein-L-isoaspartate(D-aspartate) O-methyltransferase
VDRLISDGTVRSPAVERALRSVQRHRFIPEVSLAEAYADDVVVIKRDADGSALSSLSQPTMVAIMLEQLDVEPGQRVLEIGAGTGYNAALLADLVGGDGLVTTVEYDPLVADRARTTLASVDPRVEVVTGDGEVGYAAHAPYDRIIVTVGAWDIPPAWWAQLSLTGTLVVPLRLGGLQRSIAFRPIRPGRWRSTSIETCGFVPMQGAGAVTSCAVRLTATVALHIEDQVPISGRLARALEFPPALVWTGVLPDGGEAFGELELWLLTAVRALGRLGVDEAELVAPVPAWGAPTVIADDSFAYLTRRTAGGNGAEIGVAAYGPAAADLATATAAEVQAFARASSAGVHPLIEVRRVSDPAALTAQTHGALVKRHSRLDIEWVRLGR